MAEPAMLTEAAAPLPTDNIILLRNVTWADFQRILKIRGDRPVPRLTYLEGVLELMSPSRPHESIKSMIGRLVEAWCMENGVDISPYGSWTLESKENERAAEPDECYVLGDVAEPERCDLAIEVIWTSGGIDKLEVYRRLRVREVWIWKSGRIAVHVLRGKKYVAVEASELLPAIEIALLASFVRRQPMTRAVRDYRAALRRRKR
jgi:Uma2 family endonuclease